MRYYEIDKEMVSLYFGQTVYQRIIIINRSPRSTFCRPKLLQILSLCTVCSTQTAAADPPPPIIGGGVDGGKAGAGVEGSRQYTGRQNLEQFRTTKSWAWASGNNSYSLLYCMWGYSPRIWYATPPPPPPVQCTLYTKYFVNYGTLAPKWRNTSSPKYNDDISLLISQYLISGHSLWSV